MQNWLRLRAQKAARGNFIELFLSARNTEGKPISILWAVHLPSSLRELPLQKPLDGNSVLGTGEHMRLGFWRLLIASPEEDVNHDIVATGRYKGINGIVESVDRRDLVQMLAEDRKDPCEAF